MKNYKAILFDLDGTLIDRKKSIGRFARCFQDKYGNEIQDDIYKIEDSINRADDNGCRKKNEMFEELLVTLSWKNKPLIDELIEYWLLTFPKCTEPVEGLYDVLKYFYERNICMGIITNGSSHMQNLKIDNLGIRKFMKTIIISEEVNVKKPDQMIFKLALSEIDIQANEAVFVGDNPKADVIGARSVGLTPIWVNWNTNWISKDREPVLQVNFFKDILSLSLICGDEIRNDATA